MSKALTDLAAPFRDGATTFVGALTAAGASVSVGDTLRPPQRAHLMHFSFAIARESLDPATVPSMAGVDIQWVHQTPQGGPDLAVSKMAAEHMVLGYGIVFKPALTSRHIEGKAIDMTISWQGDLKIANAAGTTVTITSLPRNGDNADLHNVARTYGVIKLATDPPHWSSDGH